MERELFICSCENTEHQIVFSWFEDDDVANVFATIHLRKKSFWTRLKYGIKYIFGYQCRSGAFDEFIFNTEDAGRLEKIVGFLKEAHRKELNKAIKEAHKIGKEGGTSYCGLDITACRETTRKNTVLNANAIVVEQMANTYSEGQHETKNKKTQD